MKLVYNDELIEKILEERAKRNRWLIIEADGSGYVVTDDDGRRISVNIFFYELEEKPKAFDSLFVSDSVIDALNEGLRCFQFSTKIGEGFARKPHDFIKNPTEFLILEYEDGMQILLEQWYG
jgi:hypothetical protein